MSLTYTTYLMIGIKTTEAKLGIYYWDDQWLPYTDGHSGDDQWLPYTDGHSGVELCMIKQDENLYIGKVLCSWDEYDGKLADFEQGINAELILEAQRINSLIADLFKLNYLDVESKLLFFTHV